MKQPKIYSSLFVFTLFFLSNTFGQEKKNIEMDTSLNPNDVGIFDSDLLPANFHKERRQKLRDLMPDSSVAVFFSSPIRNRSNDVDYEYHQDPDFYYLTGLREPHSVVVIHKHPVEVNGKRTDEIIFVQPRDSKQELWAGKRLGVDGVKQILGFEVVVPNTKFSKTDCKIDGMNYTFFPIDKNDTRDTKSKSDLFDLKKLFLSQTVRQTGSPNLARYMAQLREIKTEDELVLMKKAIDITCKAQFELMKNLTPKMAEYQSEALVEFHFKNEGAEHAGFPSIHGSGGNSCILHYVSNRRMFEENDLLVSDIGAEYHGYTADVTRTLPVNGKYSKEQAIIYNLVLQAQSAGIDSCIAGNSFWVASQVANAIIADGLKQLGIIKKTKDVKKYFPHGTSHYLGLDVHDVGTYGKLTPGQVITVEPGIYIPANSECDPKWWNIGVRIEDDILITKEKPINLSECVPRTIHEIEEIMSKK
jgi:Xaa-Pro aminopeptidase